MRDYKRKPKLRCIDDRYLKNIQALLEVAKRLPDIARHKVQLIAALEALLKKVQAEIDKR